MSYKKLIAYLSFCFASLAVHAQTDESRVMNVLDKQVNAWNNGNLEAYMQGYWDSDSLVFIGSNGLKYGYQNVLNNYKNSYPDTAAMGKISFDIAAINQLSPEHYFVIGKWILRRSTGVLQGHFTLLFKKINNNWKIVADHSS